MRHLTQLLPLFLVVVCGVRGAVGDDGFQPLFNGRDLEGWRPVNTAPSTWSVEDGMLVCSGRPIGELRTERMYQNFVLELEWRHLRPKGNAGVFIWADDITARGQPFHRGIEVQVLENAYGQSAGHTTHGDIFPIHGATMTPVNGRGGSRAFPTESRSKPSPEWNHYRVTCEDGRITLAVNGKVVTEGRDCSPRKGYICLESEGGLVHYRNLRIKELPDTPLEPGQIAIADRGYRSLYTGVDFAGWRLGEGQDQRWQSRDWVFAYTGAEADAGLVTAESFGEGGFLLDFKLGDGSRGIELRWHDSDAASIRLDPADEASRERLAKGWNRLEGSLRGQRLEVTCNGAPWIERELAESPPAGPLRLIAHGPADFANCYVRPLDAGVRRSPEKGR